MCVFINFLISPLKGNSANLTHSTVFTGLGEYYCVYVEKSSVKLFLWKKGSRMHSNELPPVTSVIGFVELWVMQTLKLDVIKTNDQNQHGWIRDGNFLIPHVPLPFQNLPPASPTMQHNHGVTSLEIKLHAPSSGATEDFLQLSHICSSSP